MKVEIYSDISCPWCWIGKTRFERALEEFAGAEKVEVAFRPYQLDPDAPKEAVPLLDYLEGRFGPGARAMTERVVENARGEGLTIDFERGVMANTFDAHRLLGMVEAERGAQAQREVASKLFAAHFTEGRDVSDLALLAGLGEQAGLDPQLVREYLESDAGVAEVRTAILGAQRLGITAVPTFVFDGRYTVQGAQPVPAFVRALEAAASDLE